MGSPLGNRLPGEKLLVERSEERAESFHRRRGQLDAILPEKGRENRAIR